MDEATDRIIIMPSYDGALTGICLYLRSSFRARYSAPIPNLINETYVYNPSIRERKWKIIYPPISVVLAYPYLLPSYLPIATRLSIRLYLLPIPASNYDATSSSSSLLLFIASRFICYTFNFSSACLSKLARVFGPFVSP